MKISPQNDRATELKVNFLLTATVPYGGIFEKALRINIRVFKATQSRGVVWHYTNNV